MWARNTFLAPTDSHRGHQLDESVCPIWKHQSNPVKLIPRKKVLGSGGKPTQAAKRETSVWGSSHSVAMLSQGWKMGMFDRRF